MNSPLVAVLEALCADVLDALNPDDIGGGPRT